MTKAIAILLPAVIGLWAALHLLLQTPPLADQKIVGHRGAAGLAPENTLASIRTAIDVGVETIEVDVHRSADGVLVVIHDPFAGRTTDGVGRVRDLTWAELSQLDAGAHFSDAFAGERIPKLDDVLALLKEEGVELHLEAKVPDRYPGIAQQIIEALEQHEMAQQTVVMSFDHGWLREFHALAPDIPVTSLGLWVGPPPLSGEEHAVGIHWPNVVLDPTLIWRMHRQGIRVSVWTVNKPWQMRLLWWLGVDAITTDRPDIAARITADAAGQNWS